VRGGDGRSGQVMPPALDEHAMNTHDASTLTSTPLDAARVAEYVMVRSR
jgi:hypothetical protein